MAHVRSQGIPEEEEGVCVLVMPSCAVGAVIGTKGAKISAWADNAVLGYLCRAWTA